VARSPTKESYASIGKEPKGQDSPRIDSPQIDSNEGEGKRHGRRKRRKVPDSPENEEVSVKGRHRQRAKRHEVGETFIRHTKEQERTVIDIGNWSLKILGDPNHTQQIPIEIRSILGRNPRTPMEHHVDLGITEIEKEIPRKLLVVGTVSVHYFELVIARPELERLVQYKPVERETWERPFRESSQIMVRNDDLLKIGEHTYQATRTITTITTDYNQDDNDDASSNNNSDRTE
jgi:hypothetical protein